MTSRGSAVVAWDALPCTPLGSPFDIELPSEDDISNFWQQCWDAAPWHSGTTNPKICAILAQN